MNRHAYGQIARIDGQTVIQTDRQRYVHTCRHTYRQADMPTYKLTCKQSQTDRQTDRHAVDRQTVGQTSDV